MANYRIIAKIIQEKIFWGGVGRKISILSDLFAKALNVEIKRILETKDGVVTNRLIPVKNRV